MKIHYAYFILLAINFNCYSQSSSNPAADSILTGIPTLEEDSTKVNTLIELGTAYLSTDINEAIKYGIEARDLAEKVNHKKGLGFAMKLIGLGNAYKGDYMEAYFQFKASLEVFESINFKDGISNILNNLGSLNFSLGEDTKAIEYHLRSLKIAEEINNKYRISTNLNNIGTVYANKPATYEKAIEYFLRVLPIFEELNYTGGVGTATTNIGEIYFKRGLYDSALTFFQTSIKMYEGTADAALALSYLGEIYAERNDFKNAFDYHNQAVAITEKLGAQQYLAQSLLSLAKTIKKKGDLIQSIETYKKALTISQEIKAKQEIKNSYESLAGGYAEVGDFKNAYKYEALLTGIKDTLYNNDEDRKLQQLQFNAEVDRKEVQLNLKEVQLNLQEATIQRQKIITYAFLILLFSILAIGVITIRFFQIRKSNREKRIANKILEDTLHELKATQAQLVQSEKMASLGELTAGIAHEIQNPLNFVNNFSDLNKELIAELRLEIKNGNFDEVVIIARDIEANEEKISHHGKRAEGIVKGMLQHSRTSTGVRELTDINALADEYLRLAYHGLRAKDKAFNAKFEANLGSSIPKINVVGQDIGRVMLNLINNAFYAVTERKRQGEKDYEPTVTVSTRKINNKIEVRVKDNGTGIPQKVLNKIFQPFFTTKPTGQGTGLGLSLSYDIVKAHGGELRFETEDGVGSEFIFLLSL